MTSTFLTLLALVFATIGCKPAKKTETTAVKQQQKLADVCVIQNSESHTPLLADTVDTKLADFENDTEVTIVDAKVKMQPGMMRVSMVGYIRANEIDASYQAKDAKTQRKKVRIKPNVEYRPVAWRAQKSEKIVFGQLETGTMMTLLEQSGEWLRVELVGRIEQSQCIKK